MENAFITPPEVTNAGPGFNRGSGVGARGCGLEERVGVHARTGGIQFPMGILCVRLSVCALKRPLVRQKNVACLPRRAAESTPRPQGWWPSYARRHALPVCGSDNPRRIQLFIL